MKPKAIKILIGDDHSVVRNGVMRSLAERFPEAVFGEASNASDVLRQVREGEWDLVILDISMPGRNGLDTLKEIKEYNSVIPVIIFSMYPEDQFAVRAIKSGASAYLTKDISSKEFSEAIRKILCGERYITPSITNLITSELMDDHKRSVHEILSDREYQVLLLIAKGNSVSTVALELSLSVKTISVYRANILKKMNLKNNSEITYYAFKNNLVV